MRFIPVKRKYTRVIVLVVVVCILCLLYVTELYFIPSDSMSDSLMKGDWVLSSKMHGGVREFGDHHAEVSRSFCLRPITRNDVVVFNYPMADTVYADNPRINFDDRLKRQGRTKALQDTTLYGEFIYMPVYKRQPYVKRCVAIPGDTFQVYAGASYVNGRYIRDTSQQILATPSYKKHQDSIRLLQYFDGQNPAYWHDAGSYSTVFPNNSLYGWNRGNFGPVLVPKKGMLIELTYVNIWIYKRIIEVYEHNALSVTIEGIFINGVRANDYTFKMDYYFMLGDNRKYSIDSMYWGFVPEDHIIGKAMFIAFSFGKDLSGENVIRWHRLFNSL